MTTHSVLVVDDDRLLGTAVRDVLRPEGLAVTCVQTAAAARAAVAETSFEVIVLDQQLPDAEGVSLCPELVAANEQAKIIFITGFPSYEHAVQALRAGAWDYLSKPFELAELVRSVKRALGIARLERVERLSTLQREPVGEAATLAEERGLSLVHQLVQAAAPSNAPVLITGETGTGKNRVARAIHQASGRSAAPWVTLNCAAVPEQLIEAELFGWERGAFTGATGAREGLFELAQGGTLLLDEIGEMPAHLQSKLLSVLEDKEVRRLGGRSARATDVRIIAATNTDLDTRVSAGQFRSDLFYRLNVVRLELPPLRERAEDLPVLCRDLLARLGRGTHLPPLAPGELERLAAYAWPGNVRELRNVLERTLILHRDVLRPSELLAPAGRALPVRAVVPVPDEDADLSLERMERRLMEQALCRHRGNFTAAARALGISLSTMKRRARAHGLERSALSCTEVSLTGST
ncbi:MAG: sigma-54 dependent transcriptional regulator [Archangium sp.]|nr:sigma-54 dependent transcriptional regulator [Archangium sp.]